MRRISIFACGGLPFALTWLTTRYEIEQKLGPPDVAGGNGIINYWVAYKKLGVGITYNTLSIGDMRALVHDLNLGSPE